MICEKTAKRYCCEDITLIENYNKAINDKEQTWHLHHKNEIILNKNHKELKALNLYYERPANELIFLTHKEHISLHLTGRHHSEISKLQISKAHKGENNSFYGKQHSEISKQKMREAWIKRKAKASNQISGNMHCSALF